MNTVTIKNSSVDPRSGCGESRVSLELASKIREAHAQVHKHAENMIQHAFAAGSALIEAKLAVPHGDWLAWLRQNCELSDRTAQSYMRLAKAQPLLEGDPQRVADLSLRAAIAHLRKPKAQGIDNDESQDVVLSELERLKKIDALSEKLGQLLSPVNGLFICINTPTDPAAADFVGQYIAASKRSGYTVRVREGGRIVTISKVCTDAISGSTVTAPAMAEEGAAEVNLD